MKGENDMQSVLLSEINGVGKKTFESLKNAGVESLEDLKLIDILQLCKRTGLSETKLREILLRAELKAHKVPSDVADAIFASGAIDRVGELAAFDVEEIQALIAKGSKPGKNLEVSIEIIEGLKAQLPRLTLDQETTRVVLLEETATSLYDETEQALHAEEPVIPKRKVEAFFAELERTLHQLSGKMKAIKNKPGETVEFSDIQSLVVSLQTDIQNVLETALGKVEPSLSLVLSEDEALAFTDEKLEPNVQIQALSQKLAIIQDQLAVLKTQRMAADEELSLASSGEEEPPAPRGEEEKYSIRM